MLSSLFVGETVDVPKGLNVGDRRPAEFVPGIGVASGVFSSSLRRTCVGDVEREVSVSAAGACLTESLDPGDGFWRVGSLNKVPSGLVVSVTGGATV